MMQTALSAMYCVMSEEICTGRKEDKLKINNHKLLATEANDSQHSTVLKYQVYFCLCFDFTIHVGHLTSQAQDTN